MSTAAAPVSRYLFDLDFDAEARRATEEQAEPTISVYEHEAHMAALERKVRAEAHKAGREEALAEGSKALAEETQRLTGVASTLLTRLDAEIAEREARATRLAITAAKKLAQRLLEREPIGDVEALFSACLAPMFDASHLVIRMPEQHLEAVQERLETVARAQGFEGRLVFMGDPDMAPGDAKIEWADGGVARSRAQIEAQIDTFITDYLGDAGLTDPAASADEPPLTPQEGN
ncbi:MAG: flagellar assembly protein FliH [Devosiaceae bacterium]|nr:flagellar assembly protein FliH [Devosiaceae bacterium MH13]